MGRLFLGALLVFMSFLLVRTTYAQSDSTATLRLFFKEKQSALSDDQMLAVDSLFPLPEDLLVDNIVLTAYVESGSRGNRSVQKAWENLAALQAYLKAQHLDVMTYTLRVEDSWMQDPPKGGLWVEVRIELQRPYAIPKPEAIKHLFEEDFRKEEGKADL